MCIYCSSRVQRCQGFRRTSRWATMWSTTRMPCSNGGLPRSHRWTAVQSYSIFPIGELCRPVVFGAASHRRRQRTLLQKCQIGQGARCSPPTRLQGQCAHKRNRRCLYGAKRWMSCSHKCLLMLLVIGLGCSAANNLKDMQTPPVTTCRRLQCKLHYGLLWLSRLMIRQGQG